MASNGAGNFYVIRQSGISHSAVESILVGLQQLSSNGGKKAASKSLASGKALLSQLRAVCFFLSVFRNSLSSGVRLGLLEILKSCQENNDVDRKIVRTVLFILADDLENTTLTTNTGDKTLPLDLAEEAFIDFVSHEVANTTNINLKSVIVTRLLGSISFMAHRRGYQGAHSAGLLRNYFNFLIDIARQPTPQKKAVVLSAVGAAFSAMRRMGEILPIDSQNALLEALKSGLLMLQRHTLALIVNTIAQTNDIDTQLSWSQWFRGVLRDPTTNTAILKDGLASSYAVRISTVIVLKCGENDRWPQETIDLLIDTINLASKAPLKFLTELVTFLTSPALSWRILPSLENKQAGLVSVLCSILTAYVRNVSLEDIYLPVLLRACESMGRFLQQRPGFDAQHSHRVFSAHMVEKDGESLKALWIALRRLYRKAIAPKVTAPIAPPVVRVVMNLQQKGDPSVSHIDPVSLNENWAFDTDNLAQASQALPSPYIFSCLIRTLIWLAPDQRYCRKEHPILWHSFSEDLFSSWDILSSPTSSLCNIGDSSSILQDLLSHLFSRVQSSMMVVEIDRDHLDSSSHASYYKCRLCCEPQYIHTLCTLTTATIRYALSPAVITLLPTIWSFIFGFASSTTNWKNALTLTNIWQQELYTIVLLMEEFLTTQSAYRRQLVASVREEALIYLVHATELKAKLHLLLYKSFISNNDPSQRIAETKTTTTTATSANEFDDIFGASSSNFDTNNPMNSLVDNTKDEKKESSKASNKSFPLQKLWQEIGWNAVYSFVVAQYQSQTVFPSHNDESMAFSASSSSTESNVTVIRGRFLLSLCNLVKILNGYEPTSSAAGRKEIAPSPLDEAIMRLLHQQQALIVNELSMTLAVGRRKGSSESSILHSLNSIIGLFPAYSTEYLLFAEVKDAFMCSTVASTTTTGASMDVIGLRKFSSALLLGVFGNPNMSFEDVTPVIMSTLPSENIIETDFDVSDSAKNTIGDARRSFMLNSHKRPSLGASQTSISSQIITDDTDIFLAFPSTATGNGFDSSKKNDSEMFPTKKSTAANDDFMDAFASTTSSVSAESNSAANKRASLGKSATSSASNTPVKQSSNTTNAKLLKTPPPVSISAANFKTTTTSSQQANKTVTTNLFGNDDVALLFPVSSDPVGVDHKKQQQTGSQNDFLWDAPSTVASSGSEGGNTALFGQSSDVWSSSTTAAIGNDNFAVDAIGAFAPTVPTNSTAAALSTHDLDIFTASKPEQSTSTMGVVDKAKIAAPLPKLQAPISALAPPRDSAAANKLRTGGATNQTTRVGPTVTPAEEKFTASLPTTSAANSKTDDDFFGSPASASTPALFPSSAPPTTDIAGDATALFGSDFDGSKNTTDVFLTSTPVVPAATQPVTPPSVSTSGLLSTSSAADLDFLGSIGSKPSNSYSSSKSSASGNLPSATASARATTGPLKPLTALPPPAAEISIKKPPMSSVAATRRQSVGGTASSVNGKPAIPPVTNVAAIFDGLVFDAPAQTSGATTTTRSQPPPKPVFDADDWSSSITGSAWDGKPSSRRTSLNAPPIDPFAPTSSSVGAPIATTSTVPSSQTGSANNASFFVPTVANSTSNDGFAPSVPAPSNSSWATVSNLTTSPQLPGAPFVPTTSSTQSSFTPTVLSSSVLSSSQFVPTSGTEFSPSVPTSSYTAGFAPSVPASAAFPVGMTANLPYQTQQSYPYPPFQGAPNVPPGSYPQMVPAQTYPGQISQQGYPINYPPMQPAAYPYPPHLGQSQQGYPTIPQQQQQSNAHINSTNNKPKNPFDEFR